MKKTICILTAVFMLLCSGCDKTAINDPETGQITEGVKKYEYTDGTYTAYYDYFDQKGNCYALRAYVSDGIIVAVSFDRYDTEYKRFSLTADAESEDVQTFKSEVKALNSSLLQYQHYSYITPGETGSLSSQYYTLAASIIRMASSAQGYTSQSVDSIRKYTVKSEPSAATGISSHLTVSYSGDYVTSISFYRTDSDGLKISDFFESDSDLSYDEEIKILCRVGLEILDPSKKDSTEVSPSLLYEYNKLCEELMLLRIPFDIQNAHFSSVR